MLMPPVVGYGYFLESPIKFFSLGFICHPFTSSHAGSVLRTVGMFLTKT